MRNIRERAPCGPHTLGPPLDRLKFSPRIRSEWFFDELRFAVSGCAIIRSEEMLDKFQRERSAVSKNFDDLPIPDPVLG
jgi:hypothetical protein